jgi:hypothetical protein
VLENRVLRAILGPKREEMTGGWKRLHNGELNFYASPNIIRVIKSGRMRLEGHLARLGDVRNAYHIFVGKPERTRPLGRPWRRWEGNIRMVLREGGWESVDWIYLAQNRDQWRALMTR